MRKIYCKKGLFTDEFGTPLYAGKSWEIVDAMTVELRELEDPPVDQEVQGIFMR